MAHEHEVRLPKLFLLHLLSVQYYSNLVLFSTEISIESDVLGRYGRTAGLLDLDWAP
jgi:hypothetical protein